MDCRSPCRDLPVCGGRALVSHLCRVPPLACALEFGLFVEFLLSGREKINIRLRACVCSTSVPHAQITQWLRPIRTRHPLEIRFWYSYPAP